MLPDVDCGGGIDGGGGGGGGAKTSSVFTLAGARDLAQTLRLTFGDRFLGFLLITFFGLKGLSSTLINTAMLPMFKELGAAGDEYQLASMVAQIPWAMKGLVGVLSDCVPIGAYHKRGYLVSSSFLALTGFIGLLASPVLGIGVWPVAVLVCLVNVQYATFDLLAEGKYTEWMQRRGGGSEAVTFVWLCINVGSLAGAFATLGLVDSHGWQPLLKLGVPFVLLALVSACRGDLPEERARGGGGVQWDKLMSEPRLFGLAAFMAVGALSVAVSAAVLGSRGQLAVLFFVSASLSVLAFRALPATLAKSNLYMFLVSIAYVDLSGPLSYYYTANEHCVPDGPGFSYSYYLAVTNIVGALGGCLGSLLFQGMQSWTFRQAFWLTTCVQIGASVFDLVIVRRWNIRLGVSDEATFLFGDAACQQIAQMLVIMPSALLNSLLCPRGAEATVYAILAGFQNFGLAAASVLGVFLTRELGIQSAPALPGGECDFSQLSTAIVIAHVLLPLAVLPLTFWLIPDVRMNDENAFALVSPAPSFRSPGSAASGDDVMTPRSCCPGSPAMSAADLAEAPYMVLADGPPVVMTGLLQADDDLGRRGGGGEVGGGGGGAPL